MEMLVYDEVAGDGAAREDADDPGHEPKDDPGKAVRDKMGFPPLAKNDPAEGGTKI
ncbi:hypothetical protein [Parasphingorhabdus halotolerans]|uniref:Uncharacterized protein n=1 Tax=Parasphingorhabdus halotolerans TaxID=2725558 RepID=A0A6H2DLW0_9SPHN|nr:hypothetical protein [Parasphingorhabdus halotolerans]QJB68646.1 hypothetical protein HF685_04570 [Parasphingorhabdus halotolerans]